MENLKSKDIQKLLEIKIHAQRGKYLSRALLYKKAIWSQEAPPGPNNNR